MANCPAAQSSSSHLAEQHAAKRFVSHPPFMNCPVVLSRLALTASTLKLTAGSSAPGLAIRDDSGHGGQQSRHETGRLRQDSEPGPRDASFDVSCRCVDHCPTGLAFPSVAIPFSLGACLAWCLSCAPGPALSQQLQPRNREPANDDVVQSLPPGCRRQQHNTNPLPQTGKGRRLKLQSG